MAEIFDGTVKIKTITGLVAVAMVQRCDHDLTEVTYRNVVSSYSGDSQNLRRSLAPEMSCCLRCFLTEWAPRTKRVAAPGAAFSQGSPYRPRVSIGVWSDVECDPMESLMFHIDNAFVVVTSIALFPDGTECRRCRKIP